MIRVRLDGGPVLRRLRRLPRRNKVIVAQILNRQWKRSRTLMVKGLSKRLGVTPQKRIRRRIVLPRGAQARPDRLEAQGLALVHVMPARWFAKSVRGRGGGWTLPLPGGTRVLQQPAAKGGMFRVQIKKYRGVMRRSAGSTSRPAKNSTRENPKRTTLPIVEVFIDTSKPGELERDAALDTLAEEFEPEYIRRMKAEFRRTWR